MQERFSTGRLTMELISEQDHGFILELVNTKGWLEFIGDRNVHSKKEAVEYIRRIMATPLLYYWVAQLKDSGVPVGIVSFLKRSYLDHFDIGFAFLPAYSGKGYAFEAASEILSVLAKDPKFPVVLATTVPANVNSIKLLKRLGLRFDREIEVETKTLHVYTNAAS